MLLKKRVLCIGVISFVLGTVSQSFAALSQSSEVKKIELFEVCRQNGISDSANPYVDKLCSQSRVFSRLMLKFFLGSGMLGDISIRSRTRNFVKFYTNDHHV